MKCARQRGFGRVAAAAALVFGWSAAALWAADGPGQDGGQPAVTARGAGLIRVFITGDEDAPSEQAELAAGERESDPGKLWIGVLCSPLENELLRHHLQVQDAMVVTEVIPGSPAEKAGLKPRDLLLMVGDKPLTDLKVLSEAIQQAGGKEVELTVLHEGERKQLPVLPAERPADFARGVRQPDEEAVAEWRMLQDVLRRRGVLAKDEEDEADGDEKADADHDLSLMLVMPGFVIPDQAKDLPSDLEVTITKKGKEAAQIVVKRGDEKWEVDAESLDKLPADLRPHVEKMLGKDGNLTIRWNGGELDAHSLKIQAPKLFRRPLDLPANRVYQLHELENKLHAEIRAKVRKQLEQTQQTLEKVRSQVPTTTLERIEQELKSLRSQLEQLRDEAKEQDQKDEK